MFFEESQKKSFCPSDGWRDYTILNIKDLVIVHSVLVTERL